MKNTVLYLKCIVFILLFLIMLLSLCFGTIVSVAGLLDCFLYESAPSLLLIPVGLFFGFIGFVAKDTFEYLSDKWR